MDELRFFSDLLAVWIVLAGMTFVVLFFVDAPYGRHARQDWGPAVGNRTGWVIMETPAAVVFGACFLLGGETGTTTAWVLAGLWEIHYVHRAFIYPLGLRGRDRRMPLAVVGAAFLFNSVNGYLNGRYLFTLSGGYPDAWLGDLRFLVGFILFIIGFLVNRQADCVLRQLRLADEKEYAIPRGGLYRWISCPNYFGEIVEWLGWAVTTWSLAGLSFTLWTVANLAPRAWSHHRWYRESFADYPQERRALVPRLW